LGQWLKGRIYERRSDLSPDGQFFLYFAMNGKPETETEGSWTAISRAPYLKALALFSKGDCWHGGGLWTGSNTYWLNDGRGHTALRDETTLRRDEHFQPTEDFGGECPGVYFHRLIRDGWSLTEHEQVARWKERYIFERSISGGWVLRKIAHAEVESPPGKGCYWDEHELIHAESNTTLRRSEWEWADLDGDRLVWASEGKLFAGRLTAEGPWDERLLFDFNEMSFSPIEAPY
jgi:hypothetical protein